MLTKQSTYMHHTQNKCDKERYCQRYIFCSGRRRSSPYSRKAAVILPDD